MIYPVDLGGNLMDNLGAGNLRDNLWVRLYVDPRENLWANLRGNLWASLRFGRILP
jgi:hypothetical protein